ncbi:MAG: HAD family hydrolase [Oscillospiraceae bacterium]|nr:HAD family hydrolase [Oscillospiraceae bacterium]
MKYKTFIFDFDYTLCDATVGIVACVNYALGQLGLGEKSCDAIKRTVGMTLSDMFFTLTKVSDERATKQFFAYFMNKADDIMTASTVLIPDSIDTLTRLKQKGCNTAIVTTKVRYRVEEILRKYKITDLIDIVIGLEDVTEPKPSPEGLLKAIDFFGVDKETVLFTGDSLIDANTANNANVDFAAVLTGTTAKDAFFTLPFKYIENTLTEIISSCENSPRS